MTHYIVACHEFGRVELCEPDNDCPHPHWHRPGLGRPIQFETMDAAKQRAAKVTADMRGCTAVAELVQPTALAMAAE